MRGNALDRFGDALPPAAIPPCFRRDCRSPGTKCAGLDTVAGVLELTMIKTNLMRDISFDPSSQ
jgi:hypothetical protein